MEKTKQHLDDKLCEALQDLQPFQRNDIGRFLGVTEHTIRNWMNRKTVPTAMMRDRLAKKLKARKK